MDKAEPLYDQFCEALNAELHALDCRIRVTPDRASDLSSMRLVDSRGGELGWVPDHVDAVSIAAFEKILG